MSSPPLNPVERSALVAVLRRQLSRCEGLRLPPDAPPISIGVPPLDRLLPAGGLRPGSLIEYLAAGEGQGAASLALAAARVACQDRRAFLVVDRPGQFYPLAAAAWGIDLSHTIVVRPANAAEELWALDQALRCPGVGAVWVRCETLNPHDFRRLQLAAESGGTLGLLMRPARFRGQPTWADLQWLVEPQPAGDRWRLRVELVRCRGGTGGQRVFLELDEQTGCWSEASDIHATHLVHSSAQLADPATARRQTRA
jgi:protein ImuA